VEEDSADPVLLLHERGLGHSVFVCAMCGAAHKLMAPGTAQVHAVQEDPLMAFWDVPKLKQLAQTGKSANMLAPLFCCSCFNQELYVEASRQLILS
jgi:hypothetical protein